MAQPANPPLQKAAQDAFLITRMVEKFHIQPRPINDEMSSVLFSRLLEELDEQRIFFTREDMNKLSVYRFKLDEEILNRQYNFLQLLIGIYKQRLIQADTLIDHIGAIPFDFSIREKFSAKEDTSYAADVAGIHTKIYKLEKLSVLNKIITFHLDANGPSKPPSKKFTDSLESLLRKRTSKTVKRYIKRILQSPMGVESIIGTIYCQALASCYDPHTNFFPPEEKVDFESHLGNTPLSFGFALSEDEDGNPQVGHMKPGGPAFQSGALNEGDKIQSIRWDEKEAIDVSGAGLTEIQGMLAASGGNKVTLSIKKADGTLRQVVLHKERLNMDEDEDKVKGFILKGPRTIGYISLPAFYSDWENNKGVNGCANDVAREIIKLKKENMEGLILDLRYNGGGSMQEAVELAGIFIDAGPVAQVQEKNTKIVTYKDITRGTIYDGPLLLLVNGQSASASEMLAGTLQDYNRALIAGSPTYGKATAQVVLPMDTTIDLASYNGKGDATSYLKITTSRLYRITGATAQFTGVKPDILLPDPADAMQQRESDEKFALRSPDITPNKYYKALPPLPIKEVASLAKKELEADSFFKEAGKHAAEKEKPSPVIDFSLLMDDRWQEKKKEVRESGIAGAVSDSSLKDQPEKNLLFTVTNHASEQKRLQIDPDLKEVNEERKENVEFDPYINMAYRLLQVIIK
ncbi:S41 family peptidase [Flavitalea flava]